MPMQSHSIFSEIERQKNEMTQALMELIRIPAIAPENSEGEELKKVGGIDGGTCAAFLRKIDVPAVVWSTIDETAHQPNEYAKIENIVNDTKVYAFLAFEAITDHEKPLKILIHYV